MQPRRLLRASSHSSMLHTCGEFQANKFKGRAVYPEKHTGGCKCPPSAVKVGDCASYVALRPTGTSHTTGGCSVCLSGARVFRGTGRVRVGWSNHCLNSFTVLCFAAALFEECLVTRRACAGHTSHEFYRLGMRHSAIIKARAAE